MKWKDSKQAVKLTISFGVLTAILLIMSTWVNRGMNHVVDDADEKSTANGLRPKLESISITNLKWAREMSRLLNDMKVTELNVQTHYKLGTSLREEKVRHLIFAHRLKDIAVNGLRRNSIDGLKDPKGCDFGWWMYSKEMQNYSREYPQFGALLIGLEASHKELYRSVEEMERLFRAGRSRKGKLYYMKRIKPLRYKLLTAIDKIIAWNDAHLEGMEKAHTIYKSETIAQLEEVDKLFNEMINESENSILSDEAMLEHTVHNRLGIIIFGFITMILVLTLTYIMSIGIIRAIRKGMVYS